ncbi:MAG: hypothetical protein JSR32_06165, partial [Proteobacteria bacterium]|nr:hypothetical protein [Pseudomonadota bacterium]
MPSLDSFRFDHRRFTAASALLPEHSTDFMRLVKDIRYGSRFQFLIAEFNDEIYRDSLIHQLDLVLNAEGLQSFRLDVSRTAYADFSALEAKMWSLVADYQAIHVVDTGNWFDPIQWEAFNTRREAVAQGIPLRLIFWLTSKPISQLAVSAPDLWAWRSGVFSFTTTARVSAVEKPQFSNPVDTRSLPQRSKRIAELRTYLTAESQPPDDIRVMLLDELAELLRSIGQFDEALRIHQEEELPVYRKIGNVRSVAVT